ncbi:MAG: hypothetical protein AAF742_01065, partial [Pseudomonadota bacterium]
MPSNEQSGPDTKDSNGGVKVGANSIVVIFTTVLINMIGFGVIMPVMPSLIMEVTGEPLAYAAQWGGIVSAVYAFMQFLCGPILGG